MLHISIRTECLNSLRDGVYGTGMSLVRAYQTYANDLAITYDNHSITLGLSYVVYDGSTDLLILLTWTLLALQ